MTKQIPQGYKQTKVGVIPEDWEVVSLGELGEFKNGINKSKENFGAGYSLVNLIDVFGIPEIKPKNFALVKVSDTELSLYNLLKGDVIFVRSSVKLEGVGLTTLIGEDLLNTVYSGFLIRYRINKNQISYEFRKYCFCENNFRQTLISMSSTSANTNINQGSLNKLLLRIPPLKEQEKIAGILTTWDEVITKQKQLIEQKQVFKKSIIQRIFSQKIRFKDDNGNDYPDSWQKHNLIKVAKTSIGLVTTMTTSYIENNGIPLIRNSDILPNKIKQDLVQLSHQFANKYNNRKLRYLDIVTVHTGDVGISSVINKKLDGCHGFATLNTRVDQKILNPFFLSYYFNSHVYINYAIKMSTGDGRCNFNLKDFNNSIIPIPSLEEQNKIINFLNSIDDEITKQTEILEHLNLQKQSLMQKLLTGQVRIKI